VVGGRDRAGAGLRELLQHRLREGRSLVRVRAGAGLVDQDERVLPDRGEHVTEVGDVRAEGGQVVLDRLLVPNVGHNLVEERERGVRRHRKGQSVGEHQREEANGLHRHRLAPGVGAGDHERAEVGAELQVEGDHLPRREGLLLARGAPVGRVAGVAPLEVQLQDRVSALVDLDVALVVKLGDDGA